MLSLPRLYPILDVDAVTARGLDPLALLEAWLAGGVRLWQLRAKRLSSGAFLDLIDAAVARSHSAGARLIVNDRADLARLGGADGVHVGQNDLTPAGVRAVVGDAAIVGRSTHSAAQAETAAREPVSYLAIGPVFATASKGPVVDPVVGLEGVRDAVAIAARASLPVVAIGGITLDRAPDVLRAGAASVAVIGDLLVGAPGDRVREYAQVLESLTL